MKLIIAIIRIRKMNETKKALSEAGLPSFTAMSVSGRGNGRALGENYQHAIEELEPNPLLIESVAEHHLKAKRMINLVVTDDKKDLAVETIIKVNQTNNSGDGKIFVLEALESVKVSTGERGILTLD